jgi:hypothetical protein
MSSKCKLYAGVSHGFSIEVKVDGSFFADHRRRLGDILWGNPGEENPLFLRERERDRERGGSTLALTGS